MKWIQKEKIQKLREVTKQYPAKMNKDVLYVIACYLPDSKTRCAFAQVSTKAYKATELLPNVLPNGKRHGLCKIYYDNRNSDSVAKKLCYECTYKDDNRHGLRKTYSKSGKLLSVNTYKNDKRHGLCKGYFDNGIEDSIITGKLSYECTYKDDNRHGLCKSYYN